MVRDERLLSPAQAVHKLTGQPAARLGLGGRGVLAPGAYADVTVFDPARFEDRGTTFEPTSSPTASCTSSSTACTRSATGADGRARR